MTSEVFQAIRAHVREQGRIPVELDLGYTVLFSTLQGNLPVNTGITGQILHYPVNLKLHYKQIPNTMGYYPVNTRVSGTIGGAPVSAELKYRMFFSTIAGNIPVVSEVIWTHGGQRYALRVPYTLATAAARGEGQGGGFKSRKMHGGGAMKFSGGFMREAKEGEGNGNLQEAGRPIPRGIEGTIEDVAVDLRFDFTYFNNTSSGRSPINVRARGFLDRVPA